LLDYYWTHLLTNMITINNENLKNVEKGRDREIENEYEKSRLQKCHKCNKIIACDDCEAFSRCDECGKVYCDACNVDDDGLKKLDICSKCNRMCCVGCNPVKHCNECKEMYCHECKPSETCCQCDNSYCEDCLVWKPITYNEQLQGDFCMDCGEVTMDRLGEIEDDTYGDDDDDDV